MAKSETTTATTHVRDAVPAEEKALTAKVAPLFKEGSDEQKAAIRFGRKLLRVKKGTRKSAPPKGILSDEAVAKIYKALGIAKPERKVAEPKAETETAEAAEETTDDES